MKIKKLIAIVTVFSFLYCSVSVVLCSPLESSIGTEKKVPIIMYHNVLNRKSLLGKFVITPDEFEQDLAYLKEHGYETVVMSDLTAFVNEGKSLPQKPIVLTFDDGDYAIEKYVRPLLEKYNMKAVVSIIGKVTDDYSSRNRTDVGHYPNLTWEQINKLIIGGHIEIQNHTYNLHKSNGAKKKSKESADAYKQRLTSDLDMLQNRMSEMTKYKATTLAYPYGSISPSSDDIIKEIGFTASLSCFEKINTLETGNPKCLFSLGRFLRPHGISSEKFFNKFINIEEKTS